MTRAATPPKAIPLAFAHKVYDDLVKRDPKANIRGCILLAFGPEGYSATSWADTKRECTSLGKTLDAIGDAVADEIVPWPYMHDAPTPPADKTPRTWGPDRQTVEDVVGWIRWLGERTPKAKAFTDGLADGLLFGAPWRPSCDGTPAMFSPDGKGRG